MTQAQAMGRGHAAGSEVSGRRASTVCEGVAGVEAGAKGGLSERALAEKVSRRGRSVHSEHRVRIACADAHAVWISHRIGESENGCGEGGPRLTLRDGHVERKVNEIVGLSYGLPGRGLSLSWRTGGWP